MTHDLTESEKNALEMLMDSAGVDSVLMTLSELCGAKADHVRTNWQNESLARRWSTLEGAIGVIVPTATGL